MSEEIWIKGRTAAAKWLGVTPKALRNWLAEDGFPDCSKGHPMVAITKWRENRGRKGSRGADSLSEVKLARETEQLEHDRIKTHRELINLDLQRGGLYPRPATELVLSTFFTLYADGCEQIINTLPGTAAVPKKYQATLRKQLRTEFEALSKQLRESIAAELLKLEESQQQLASKTK
jgi:hypothetical protein